VPDAKTSSPHLPEDNQSLKAMLCSLLRERDSEKQRADQLYLENLRLQVELARYRKWTYGPRADRLSAGELAQMLMDFAETLEQKPILSIDLPQAEPEPELRRVKRRKGRRALANFENLPVTTQVYELSAEERLCPCCGVERKEIGAEQSWQIEYLPGRFERIQHVRKKYACAKCEGAGEAPQIEVAARAEAAIEKGLGRAGAAGLHRDQQVLGLPTAVPAGKHFCAAGIRDLASDAVGLVRRCGRSGRAVVPADGGAGAGIARGGHR
jgi:hypothetical protein